MFAGHPIVNILSNLIHEVDVYRETRHQDPYGGDVRVWTKVLSGVKAWIQTKGQMRDDEFDKKEFSVKARIYFQTDPGLNERDLIYHAATNEAFELASLADQGVRFDGPIAADCMRWSGDVDTLVVS